MIQYFSIPYLPNSLPQQKNTIHELLAVLQDNDETDSPPITIDT